jgi:signal transduction histidine kinase
MKVLIVDDVEANRKLIRVNLEAEGIETREASDGIQALAFLRSQRVDAIVSDILMPNMDGYGLCQAVRRDEALHDIWFIFYTSAYTSRLDEKLALDCGADRYLKKPAMSAQILEALRDAEGFSRERDVIPPVLRDAASVMKQYNEALVRKLQERNEELERARAEITEANEELERRVKERTDDLVAANHELEAFSRSIAHDLRSPLTAIDGFSHILIEQCRGKVSEDAMEQLGFISEAATRMNELTKDLLRFAMANRGEMSPNEIDLSALSTAIFRDLETAQPERSVEFVRREGVIVTGDFGLLRIALEHLLNNAWKYTARTKAARVEFGVDTEAVEPAIFIRDNGVGFDMAEADKLFITFGRLRSAAEFPGTGIGLSTVRRIIARHGGRIWAEAVPSLGATFFFTLGAFTGETIP